MHYSPIAGHAEVGFVRGRADAGANRVNFGEVATGVSIAGTGELA